MKRHVLLTIFLLTWMFIWGQAPSANFTAATTTGCAPLVVSFQDQSTGSPVSWKWDFGNGTTSALQNPSSTYFNPGTYTVTLTVTNASGSNTLTRQGLVTVYDKPAGNFSADKTTGCFPLDVQFTDLSVASSGTSIVSWQWDFGNGAQSTEQSPRVAYTRAGNYSVNLRVTNDKGCFANVLKSSFIKVSSGVQVAFSNTAIDRCHGPFPVQFTNASTGPGMLTYLWSFGDGTTSTVPSPQHTYAAAGNYTVSLAVASSAGCSDTLRKTNLISIPDLTSTFKSPDSVCVFAPAEFTNTPSTLLQSSLWQFGDGTTDTAVNATKIYNTPGVYTVRLTNNYGFCSDTSSKKITVSARPKAQFNAANNLQCKPPQTVRFQDASSNAVNWQWNFGDGQTSAEQSPSHTYTDYGDYTVTLIVTNREGCTDTLVQKEAVRISKPEISFPDLPQTGCIPYNASFKPVIKTVDNISSYLWNFGDGQTSTAASPTHTYPNQGSYNVSLTITTSTGCTETLALPNAVTVGRKPVVDFTAAPNPVCAFQPVQFSGTASEGDVWSWNFSGGATANVQSPLYAFQDTGTFTVSLTVTNSGCSETVTKNNLIKVKPPISRFAATKDCNVPKRFTFTDNSVGATTWLWNFGDGQTSTMQNPVHDFPATGVYTVSLTVTNDTCSHTSTTTLNVFQDPLSFVADIREACKTTAIQFTAQVPNPSTIVAYNWQFGNGATSAEINPLITYTTAGNFPTTLTVTDIYGCASTLRRDNYIRINGPTASFSATNSTGCRGLNVQFSENSTTDGLHPITNWQWQYGDGTTQSFNRKQNFSHTYKDSGTYDVQLLLTDAKGCKDSLRIENLVRTSAPKAVVAASDTLSCLGSAIQFTNASAAQNIASQWQFGDGNRSTVADPLHRYADTGAYTVHLRIRDENGCSDSVTMQRYITIKQTKASFTVSDSVGGCIPYQVNFYNTSGFYEESFWNFGNAASTLTNPAYTFVEAGIYPVTLSVTGRGGCTDTARTTITVYHDSTTTFSYSPLEGCQPVLLRTTINSPVNKNYSWDFGDGTIVTTSIKDTVHRYTTFGNFLPRLIISDSGNCLIPYVGTDTVRVRGAVTKFNFDKKLFCDNGEVQFLDSTTSNENIISYLWNFGDGTTSSEQNPAHNYQRPGLYTVSLTAQTESLCKDTMVWKDAVKVVRSPSVTILGDSAVCRFETATHRGAFLQADTSAVSWQWQFPNNSTASTLQPPGQRYSDTGDFFINVIAINSSGCTDTATKRLRVNPLPTISLPATITSLVGTPITIQPARYASNVVSYVWTPPTGLSCTDCPQPIATPKSTTTYQVLVTDSNGCRNTAEVQVIILCANANVFMPNTFSPNGDGNNDVFYVRGTGLARAKSLRIFNRWGEVVFQRQNFNVNDPAAGWNGTYKGVKLAPDTYIYQVDVFCENSETVRFDGSIALVQ